MSLTGAHIALALRSAGAGGGLVMGTDAIAKAFNDAMRKYGDGLFITADRVAALISECMMESAYFRTTEEYNTKKGDYQPYRGRTFIQITWKSNYEKFGKWCKQQGLVSDADYFVKNPSKLADLKWAAIGGVWYFTQVNFYGKPLVEYSGNIGQVGKAVNLGDPFHKVAPNGWKAREAAYIAVRALGPDIVLEQEIKSTNSTDWMVGMKKVYERFSDDVVLKPGEHEIKTSPEGYTLVTGENEGIDLVATVALNRPVQNLEYWWRIVDYKAGTPTKVYKDFAHVTANQKTQVSFKGDLPKPSATGRSMRLRLCVSVPKSDAEIKITDVQTTGWKMD